MRDKFKKTKIVATLGPATNSKSVLKKLLDKGVNVFRINFSHADYDDVKESLRFIDELNQEYNYNVATLADLQGPKIRIGEIKNDIKIDKNDELVLKTGKPFVAFDKNIHINYTNFAKDVKVGEKVLVDDGKLIFKVVSVRDKQDVTLKALIAGVIRSKKGVNLPNTKISLPALTPKDIKDAKFAISMKFDWIALSFVRDANDLIQLKTLIEKNSVEKIPIIAKIEIVMSLIFFI